MSRRPRPHGSARLVLFVLGGGALLGVVAFLAVSLLERRTGEHEDESAIDWSREPNPFGDGGDRDAFRALMREVDHHFLAVQNAVDVLRPSASDAEFERLLARARALAEVVDRPQFRYAEAPSAGLFEERRADLRAGAAGLYGALVARDVESVQQARSRLARACDQCHAAVRLQSDVKPLMRYLEGLVDRSQTLLVSLAEEPRAALYRRFAELATEVEGIAAAPALRHYRRDAAYERHGAALEEAARALRVAAEAEDRRAVEVASLRVTLGACEACHREYVK